MRIADTQYWLQIKFVSASGLFLIRTSGLPAVREWSWQTLTVMVVVTARDTKSGSIGTIAPLTPALFATSEAAPDTFIDTGTELSDVLLIFYV